MTSLTSLHILLTDYNYRNPATYFGLQLAKTLQLPVCLLAIEKIPNPAAPPPIVGASTVYANELSAEDMRQRAILDLKKLKAHIVDFWPHISCELAIASTEGKAIDLVIERHPELLLMEAQSDLNFFNEWFGTYETRIAEGNSGPVLILPTGTIWKPVKRLLYLMDVADDHWNNLDHMKKLANRLNADVQIALMSEVDISQTSMAYHNLVKELHILNSKEGLVFHQIFGQEGIDNLSQLLKETRSDWLVFEQKNKSLFGRMFSDYNNKRLILQSEVPVLVF